MDKILYNGKIYTANKNDDFVEAVYIKGNKIEKIGGNDEILGLKDENTDLINLGEKLVVPGFNDSHLHYLNCSENKKNVDLRGVNSIDEIISRFKDHIEQNKIPKGAIVEGIGWNQDYFTEGEKRFPNKDDLDKISKDHLIISVRACYHIMAVNSRALDKAGVTKGVDQVEGGEVYLDKNGFPTGVFSEEARNYIKDLKKKPGVEDIKETLKLAMEDLHREGITSIQTDDIQENTQEVIAAYKLLEKEGNLQVRVYQQCLLQTREALDEFLDLGYRTGQGTERFKIGPLKLLSDGSLGARTAYLSEPYIGTDTCGIPVFTKDELEDLVTTAHKNDMQIAIHGIGDRAIDEAIESLELALKENPRKDHRHGIVHFQITTNNLMDRLKAIDGVAYVQPIFLDYDWKMVPERINSELEKTSYNWKTILDKGIKAAFSSDSPVEPFSVIQGIYHGVTRKGKDGKPEGGWLSDQKISMKEAIRGFTIDGAYMSFEEDIKGSIEEGKLADIVVLSQDLFEIPEEKILDTKVDMTIFDGNIVYKNY